MTGAHRFADPFEGGALRLGVIPTVGPYLLPDVAPVLREQYQGSPSSGRKKTVALLSNTKSDLDGAIVALGTDVGDLPHVVLGKDAFVFAAAPNRRRPPGPSSRTRSRVSAFLLLDDGHCFREQALSC